MADEISLTEAQFAEAVRALQVQLRAYTAINNGVTAFLQLKEHVATLERKKVELAEQVAAFKATMEKSADLQVEVISRYEKERMKKESEERAKLEAYKKECYEQGKELTDAITELQSRVAQAQARAEKAEHEAEDKIALLDEQVAARHFGLFR